MSGYPDATIGCGPCLFMAAFLTGALLVCGYSCVKFVLLFIA